MSRMIMLCGHDYFTYIEEIMLVFFRHTIVYFFKPPTLLAMANYVSILFLHGRCFLLSHQGWVTHICVSTLTVIGSDHGLSPGRRQAIIWTKTGILLIGPLGTNFSEILLEIYTFSFTKMHLKMSFGKWRPFCLGLNVLSHQGWVTHIYITLQWRHVERDGVLNHRRIDYLLNTKSQ